MALSRWSSLRQFTLTAVKSLKSNPAAISPRILLSSPEIACHPRRYSSFANTINDREARHREIIEEAEKVEAENIFERDFDELTVDKYESLIKNDEDREYIQKVLDDYEYIKYCTSRVPSTISVADMSRLIDSCRGHSDTALANYFNFLFKKQMMKLATKRVRHRRAEPHRVKIASQKDYEVGALFDPSTNEPIYRKWHNSLLIRLKESTMAQPRYWNTFTSTKFAPKLVIDTSFSNYMDRREISLTATQLAFVYGENGRLEEPFDLYFCNNEPNSILMQRLVTALPNLYDSSLISLEERSYLDLFPKEKLLYLTPDAKKPLTDFNDDDIMIIGALVDKTIKKPLTMAKARLEGLRMARLPIDEYVVWGKSTKSLTLNQVLTILSTYRDTRDWRTALLTGVPARKLKSKEEIEMENEVRKRKLLKRNRIMNRIPFNNDFRAR